MFEQDINTTKVLFSSILFLTTDAHRSLSGADYWKKREEEEKKKKKDLAAAKKPVIPSKDAEMEVLPETDIIRKGPHHLQKKFKGETVRYRFNWKNSWKQVRNLT